MIDVASDTFFAGVQYEGDVPIGDGQTMPLPLRYFDTGSFSGRFLADADAVREVLPSRRLTPVLSASGQAIVLLVAYDHRHSDLGHYRELAAWIPVTAERDGRTGLYCHLLPVDSEAAYIAGVEMAGFPKFLAAFTIEASPEGCRCEVSADGRAIVTLIVRPGAPGEPLAPADIDIYTVQGAELLRSSVQLAGGGEQWAGKGGAHLAIGDHPCAQALRQLQIEPAGLDHSWAPHRRLILHGPNWRAPL